MANDVQDMAELNKLLAQASRLDELQWRRCWDLVHELLQGARPRALTRCLAIGYARDDIFTEFFSQKFFLRTAVQPLPRIENEAALAGWWAHVCSDVMRHHLRHGTLSLDDIAESAATCKHADMAPEQRRTWGLSARRFLLRLETGLRAMVREHLCADAGEALPLVAVARRWRIRSYHYRARQLGLTGTKGDFSADFGRSQLGLWLHSIGCDVSLENRIEMKAALEILCIEASARPEIPEPVAL